MCQRGVVLVLPTFVPERCTSVSPTQRLERDEDHTRDGAISVHGARTVGGGQVYGVGDTTPPRKHANSYPNPIRGHAAQEPMVPPTPQNLQRRRAGPLTSDFSPVQPIVRYSSDFQLLSSVNFWYILFSRWAYNLIEFVKQY